MKTTHATAALLAALTATSAVAVGATTKPTVKAAKVASISKPVVVDGKKGMTLYYLAGDKKGRLCNSAACVSNWPPLTVKSLHTKVTKGKGINGKLTVFKRSDGKFQVMLRNKPLYRFVGDSAKGQANGDGIVAFGGTWHATPALGY